MEKMKIIKTFLLFATALPAVAPAASATENTLERPLPAEWRDTGAPEAPLPADDRWWQGFNDPLLDSLVTEAEQANYDLTVAARRMEAARRQVDVARAAYYPQVDVAASYARTRATGASANSYSLGANVSWEIDVFGKITAQVNRGKAQYRASRADWVGAMLSVAGQVASTYVELRVAQAEHAVALEHILKQDTISGIARTRFECGLASKIDLDQALSVLYSTQAAVPALETSIRSYINALALLLGVYPSDIEARLEAPATFPDYHRAIETGVPAELLRRRPDIVAAEYNLAAAAASLGIAHKDFLPTLSIEGSVGVAAPEPGDMFTSRGFNYSVKPTLSWTLFDGFSRRAASAAARADMEALEATYNFTVMNAYDEVDNAIVAYRNAMKQIVYYEKCVEVSKEFLDLSLDLYTQGLAEFTRVASAQVDLLGYSNSLIVARGDAMSALITLYKALGGGFDQYEM